MEWANNENLLTILQLTTASIMSNLKCLASAVQTHCLH